MKKVILIGILSVASIFGTSHIWAAGKKAGSEYSQKAKKQKRKKGDDKKLEKWKKELNLTEKQVAELKVIFKEHREKMKALKSSGTEISKDERKAIQKEFRAKINNLLDENQRAKLKEMRKNNKGKGKKEGQNKQRIRDNK